MGSSSSTTSSTYTIPNELSMTVSPCTSALSNAKSNVDGYKAYITKAQTQYNTDFSSL